MMHNGGGAVGKDEGKASGSGKAGGAEEFRGAVVGVCVHCVLKWFPP